MKIVFFGTPYYVIPVLESLYKTFRTKSDQSPIVAVVTQKPKPTGRHHEVEYSAVDSWAHQKKIPIYFEPNDIINNHLNAEVGILASFGQILTGNVIDYFPYGIVNLHPSLLPKFRGASPVQGALVSGETVTGLSFTKMDTELDKGNLISQFKEEIAPDDTTQILRDRLFLRSAEVIATLLPAYISGKTNLKKLESFPGTFTSQITKEDAYIKPEYLNAALLGKSLKKKWTIKFITNFSLTPTPENMHNLIRAMNPWPIAWSTVKIKDQDLRFKILKSHLQPLPDKQQLIVDEVQLEGKNPVTWKQLLEGYPDMKLE